MREIRASPGSSERLKTTEQFASLFKSKTSVYRNSQIEHPLFEMTNSNVAFLPPPPINTLMQPIFDNHNSWNGKRTKFTQI